MMTASIFADLCDVTDALSRYTRDLASGPERDRLEDIIQRLDTVIERTVGVSDVFQPQQDEGIRR
jgi:hypothetical protein